MGRLTPTERLGRQSLDFRTTAPLVGPGLARVQAFASAEDLRARREASLSQGEAGRATMYLVHYAFPILCGAGQTMDSVTVQYDLLAGGNYPYSAPLVSVVSRPLPWSPHVHPISGLVCLGEQWSGSTGRMLLAHLVCHVMRILNCDEPAREPWYTGWNGDAVRYWRDVLKYRPLNPDLVYPPLSHELTHGTAEPAFRSVQSSSCAEPGGAVFRALAPTLVETGFRPLGEQQ